MATMRAKRHTLANALRAAASAYDQDAGHGLANALIRGGDGQAAARLASQFQMQAFDARRLADEIEQADTITLED